MVLGSLHCPLDTLLVFTRCAAVSVARDLRLETEYVTMHPGHWRAYCNYYTVCHTMPTLATSPSFPNFSSNFKRDVHQIESINPCVLAFLLEEIKGFFVMYFQRKTWGSFMCLAIATLVRALSFQPRHRCMGLM
jgi:hypothetical protein